MSPQNTHGLFELLDLPPGRSKVSGLRTLGVDIQLVALAPQPLDDRCQALSSDPLGPLEAPMTEAGDLAGSEVGTIKDLPQRIPLHRRQLPVCRHLTGWRIARA